MKKPFTLADGALQIPPIRQVKLQPVSAYGRGYQFAPPLPAHPETCADIVVARHHPRWSELFGGAWVFDDQLLNVVTPARLGTSRYCLMQARTDPTWESFPGDV